MLHRSVLRTAAFLALVFFVSPVMGWQAGVARHDGGGKSLSPSFVERPGIVEFSGQLIARPRQDLDPAARPLVDAAVAGMVAKYYPEVDEFVLDVGSREGDMAAGPGWGENHHAGRLMRTGLFEYVHPNWKCFRVETIPNDPQFGAQWHHGVMRSAQAWDLTTGSPSVIAAFTDTGIDLTHPDLAANRVPGFNAVTDLAEVNGGQVWDVGGHGTHVAGCAAAIGNNGVGVAGIGWNFKIMMIRVEEPGWGYAYLDDLLQGARWAADNGAKTVSTSYSGVDYAGVGTTGTYCKNRGTLHLYAAGNDGRDLSWFDYPNTIVVGASHSGEDRAGWSAYGKAVDVFAPGESILSSCIGGGWCYASGTSMATPVANGVCAMIWAARPSLTAQQVENILFATCKDWGAPGNDDVYGWGRVDTYDAVKAAVSFGSNHPVAVDDNAGKILAGASLRIDVLANDFDPQSQPISIVGFSPASGLGGTVSLSTGTGPGGRDELLYQAPAVGPGMDTFTYTIQDSTGLTDGATVRLQVMTLDEFRVPENPNYPMPGVEGRYYALSSPTQLPDFSVLTPIVVKVRPDININAGGGVFGDSGLADNVGAVFEGWLLVPADDVYTLYANSDDGSRLLIGDTVVVSNDGLHGPVEAGGEIALRAGRHRIRVEYFEAGGGATLVVSIAGGGLSKQVIPSWMWSHGDFADSDFLDPASPGVTRPGLDANYYATTLFITTLPNFAALTPYLVTSVDMLNYAPTSGVFANSGRSDAVAALFTGFVTVGETGFHTFYSNSDEGSRVYVGGHLVVDNNGLHTMQERSGMIGLKAGTHALRVEYFERTGSCGLIVSHQGPSTPKAVIAAAALSRVNPCPADFDGSGFVDTDDFDAFVAAFEAGGNDADFDGSGFVDTDDFDSFVGAFTLGC